MTRYIPKIMGPSVWLFKLHPNRSSQKSRTHQDRGVNSNTRLPGIKSERTSSWPKFPSVQNLNQSPSHWWTSILNNFDHLKCSPLIYVNSPDIDFVSDSSIRRKKTVEESDRTFEGEEAQRHILCSVEHFSGRSTTMGCLGGKVPLRSFIRDILQQPVRIGIYS